MVRQPLLVDLTIKLASFFKPYIKIVFNPSKESQVAFTALIDTGVVCSIIREAYVHKDCYVPTQVSFGSTSREGFYNRKYTRPIEVKPFGIRHEFIAFNQAKTYYWVQIFSVLLPLLSFFLKGSHIPFIILWMVKPICSKFLGLKSTPFFERVKREKYKNNQSLNLKPKSMSF